MVWQACTEVSVRCPVSLSTYGYIPNLSGNVFFTIAFALLTFVQVVWGHQYRTWTFIVSTGVGCLLECIGYIGRVRMYSNVWDLSGFRQQICCLILAPSFLAAGIYLSIKHIVIEVGAEHSRLKPSLYTWIFISCDIVSIILQAVGGGVAASGGVGDTNTKLLDGGNYTMVGGICFQVVSMTALAVLVVDFFLRARKNGADRLKTISTKTRIYIGSCLLAFVAIYIRCIYRIPEMVGGWGNPLMRKEKEFLVLDGAMVLTASLSLTMFHPGYWFPALRYEPSNPLKKRQK